MTPIGKQWRALTFPSSPEENHSWQATTRAERNLRLLSMLHFGDEDSSEIIAGYRVPVLANPALRGEVHLLRPRPLA